MKLPGWMLIATGTMHLTVNEADLALFAGSGSMSSARFGEIAFVNVNVAGPPPVHLIWNCSSTVRCSW